jgi:hypothetical protein
VDLKRALACVGRETEPRTLQIASTQRRLDEPVNLKLLLDGFDGWLSAALDPALHPLCCLVPGKQEWLTHSPTQADATSDRVACRTSGCADS